MLRLSFLLPLLTLGGAAAAQAPDTASYPYRFYHFSLGTLTTADGETQQLYLPYDGLSFTGLMPYFDQQPLRHKDQLQKFMSVSHIHSVAARQAYYETVLEAGQPSPRMARRVLDGAVPVFIWVRNGAVVPNRWYVRDATGDLVQVKADTYRVQVVPLLAGQPALADSVQRDLKGYRFANLYQVMRRYNQLAAQSPAAR
ncbi:hypothetical protein [Hymenobacter sp. CRA2]|uniref:hypothetical protein n=1 Tax=Hymenobacter sp. CRA2 TaxID=1955620 RepID=UPI00099019CB|nr:hypothetical protein [Hymenobacter sp. CRA2]OON70762.1 hypothetical protein B0919_01750 [Hymenobacter sp. CRA2]